MDIGALQSGDRVYGTEEEPAWIFGLMDEEDGEMIRFCEKHLLEFDSVDNEGEDTGLLARPGSPSRSPFKSSRCGLDCYHG